MFLQAASAEKSSGSEQADLKMRELNGKKDCPGELELFAPSRPPSHRPVLRRGRASDAPGPRNAAACVQASHPGDHLLIRGFPSLGRPKGSSSPAG